jgi:dTDP-4-dehydrorhamnose 3,5-epimerase
VDVSPLAVPDAWVVTPQRHDDNRGSFLEWFRADRLEQATGRSFTPLQANHSVSKRGTLRGVHFADVPPGQAKYVYCVRGAALDVVVDLRTGSPTFGRSDAVRLDDVDRRAVFLAEGLGHAFLALTDDTSLTYLVSTTYNPAAEHGVNPLDPALALPWPADVEPVLSAKDEAAPTLAEARADRLLPEHTACLRRYDDLRLGGQ